MATIKTSLRTPIEAGQVKANYTGLTLTGFTSMVEQTININAATATLSSSPTTTFPRLANPATYASMFAATRGTSPTGRLIENPVNGQVHLWRLQATYSGKTAGNNGELLIRLKNPVSGFVYAQAIVMPSGTTTGPVNAILLTIADPASIPSPNGYILTAQTSFSDATYQLVINSLTRVSLAFGQ